MTQTRVEIKLSENLLIVLEAFEDGVLVAIQQGKDASGYTEFTLSPEEADQIEGGLATVKEAAADSRLWGGDGLYSEADWWGDK